MICFNFFVLQCIKKVIIPSAHPFCWNEPPLFPLNLYPPVFPPCLRKLTAKTGTMCNGGTCGHPFIPPTFTAPLSFSPYLQPILIIIVYNFLEIYTFNYPYKNWFSNWSLWIAVVLVDSSAEKHICISITPIHHITMTTR